MDTNYAHVVRIRAKSGNRDNDHFQAQCFVCPWEGGVHSNRTVEGRTLAERDAASHNRARHTS